MFMPHMTMMTRTWQNDVHRLTTLQYELNNALRQEGMRETNDVLCEIDRTFEHLKTAHSPKQDEHDAWMNCVRKMTLYHRMCHNAYDLVHQVTMAGPPVALYFTKMPSKRVYHNAKKIGDSMDVQLLMLPGWSCQPEVKVTLDTLPKKGIQVYGNNHVQTLAHDRATFHDIHLHGGLRMDPARFCVEAIIILHHPKLKRSVTFTVEACTPQEFIVVSNTNQWGAAEGILLEKELFQKPHTLIPWDRFIAKLRTEFVRQTRQRFSDTTAAQHLVSEQTHKMNMALSKMNLACKLKVKHTTILSPDAYYHPLHSFDVRCLIEWCKQYVWEPQKKLALSPLSRNDFRTFWQWFGKLVHHIRHNRTLRSLWREGLIPTLLTHRMAIETVARQPAGYFVLRFSTSKPNDLVVTYRRQNGQVITTVVEDRPKHGSVDADAILMYLQRKPMLTHMFVQELPQLRAIFVRKEEVLRQHRLRKCLTSPTTKPENSMQILLKRPNDYTLIFLH